MNLLHISDMHFGSRHWDGDDEMLLDKLNSYQADIVINTGDNTTDGLESEFKAAGEFLKSIECSQVFSIPGNHDKRNMRCQDFYRMYIDRGEVIFPMKQEQCKKRHLFLDKYTTGIRENFTDINYVRKITVKGETFLIVSLDTNEFYRDNGYVDREVLRSVSHEIERDEYDQLLLLNHHSILDTDSDPLFNSRSVIDFVRKHNIEHVFCGHTHKLSLMRSTDLYHDHSFTQYKNGSLSSFNNPDDTNMFLFYENFGDRDMRIQLVRILRAGDELCFREETIDIN
jgi:3',5'-cyclic AMP phosphodiesterase CpdA